MYTEYRMVDKAVTIVKSALQQYYDSFLNPNGVNRKFFTSSLSPVGLQFVTDLTYDDQMKTSPNLRKTYLARFFAENIGRLPSILIIDTGVEIVDPGINELVSATMNADGSWEGYLCSLMKVSVSTTVATLSEEDTSTLATMISTMISPLATVINNCAIHDPDTPWEVRLPMTGLTLGQASSVNIEGDSKTTVWTRALDMVCEFETQIGLKQHPFTYLPPAAAEVGRNGVPLPRFLNLAEGQQIPLGSAYPVLVDGMLDRYYLGVSDPSVALVTSEPPYFIQPKAQGKALLLVIDRSAPAENASTRSKSSGYVTDVPFLVVR
jgi:hypothetical protein